MRVERGTGFRTHGMPAHDFDRLFVRIGVGRTHVHYEAALGRHDVVLRPASICVAVMRISPSSGEQRSKR